MLQAIHTVISVPMESLTAAPQATHIVETIIADPSTPSVTIDLLYVMVCSSQCGSVPDSVFYSPSSLL